MMQRIGGRSGQQEAGDGRTEEGSADQRLLQDYVATLYKNSKRAPRFVQVLISIAIFVTLLTLDSAYVVVRLDSSLTTASRRLSTGVKYAVGGELKPASSALTDAKDAVEEARTLTAHPSFFIGSRLPWFKEDVGAIKSLVSSADAATEAGLVAVDTAVDLGGTSREDLVRNLYQGGAIQFDSIRKGEAGLREVGALLDEARTDLLLAPESHFDRVNNSIQLALRGLDPGRDLVASGVSLLDVLPRLLGNPDPRTYLLAFLSPSEATGGGGLMGLFGILEVEQGRFALSRVAPATDVYFEPLQDRKTPSWFQSRYGVTFRGLSQPLASPSFPVTGGVIQRLYERATGHSVDGVWAFDPIALQQFTRATGPLRGQGIPTKLGPDNTARVILHDAYEELGVDPGANFRFLSTLILDFYKRLNGPDLDARELLRALAAATTGQHFKLFSPDPAEELALERLGVDGGLDPHIASTQFVFHNNLEGNKVDYFLRREILTSVVLDIEGSAEVSVTAQMTNNAAAGPPSILLGLPQLGQRPGVNKMELNYVLPQSAILGAFSVDGNPRPTSRYSEGLFPVAAARLTLEPGASLRATMEYTLPDSQVFTTGGRRFELTLHPQAMVFADTYSVLVRAPRGFLVVPPGGGSPRRLARFDGTLDAPTTITAELVPTRQP